MDKLLLLGALEFANYIYQHHLKSLTVVNLDYVVIQENVHDGQIFIDLDLNDHLQLQSPDLVILNPTIHVSLPLNKFPSEEDYLGFEYELSTVNKRTLESFKETIVIKIQLFDTLVNR